MTYLRDNKVPAYVNYNHADEKRAKLEADRQHWKELYPNAPFRHEKIEDDQYSVLIGGFQDMDSARDYMKKVLKDPKAPLPPLKLSGGKSPYPDAVWQEKTPNGQIVTKHAPISPYYNSFVSRNPAISTAKAVDPFLKELNAGEEFSLLKCPAPWSMAIQQYGGGGMFVPLNKKADEPSMVGGFLDKLWGSDKPNGETALNAAAAQAHETASLLRKAGFEAYVLHTRHHSIVTIGGFNGPADQAMVRTAERLAGLNPKTLEQLHLLKNFYSCEVPRP